MALRASEPANPVFGRAEAQREQLLRGVVAVGPVMGCPEHADVLGNLRVEPFRANLTRQLPEIFERGGNVRAKDGRAAAAGTRRTAGEHTEPPDGGLAVQAGDGRDHVENPTFLGLSALPVGSLVSGENLLFSSHGHTGLR